MPTEEFLRKCLECAEAPAAEGSGFCVLCEVARVRRSLALPKRYAACSLATCKENPGNKAGIWAVEGWLEASGKQNLFFYGEPGTGKTWLASMAAWELAKETSFVRAPEMFIDFQGSVKEHDELEVLGKYMQKPVIIFDDIGAHRVSDFVIEMFGILLDRFYSNCRTGLIFTSNLSPKQINDTMGERVASRLCGLAEPVKVEGPDGRLVKL